jgi:hypothetical protein
MMKQIIPLPESARELLLSFLLFNEAKGLRSIARQIDFSGATRRQILAITSGRLPGLAREVIETSHYNARGDLVKALSAPEFQTRIREFVLAAIPEKRRLINIHIAKCAGTDLEIALRRRHPFLHHTMSIPEATPTKELFLALHLFAIGLQFSDSIALSGHVQLGWYLKQGLIRVQDDVFTTIRHPRDRIYSQISYMLSIMVKFRGTHRFDTAGWMAAIGMAEMDPDPTPAYLVATGRRLLRSPVVARPNGICEILGNCTAESAIENLILANVEITDMERYSAWRKARFDFSPADKVNQSQPLFTEDMADAADRQVIEDLIEQDIVLYETVQKQLALNGALSIRGRALG